MAEYIERAKLIEKIVNTPFTVNCSGESDDYKDGILRGLVLKQNNVIDMINEQPTADVAELRHGEWIANRSPVEVEFMCSECGFSYIEADSYQECDYNYCPNCGARMDGDTE